MFTAEGSGFKYLVYWEGYGPEKCSWVSRSFITENALLNALLYRISLAGRPEAAVRGWGYCHCDSLVVFCCVLFCLCFSPVSHPHPLSPVCVCVGAWWQQHGAPAPHLLTTLLLYYPGLSTTSVPDYSITKGGNIVEDVSYVTSTNSMSCVFALLLTLVLVAHPVENSSIIPLCFLRANLPALLCVGCRRPCLPVCLPACLPAWPTPSMLACQSLPGYHACLPPTHHQEIYLFSLRALSLVSAFEFTELNPNNHNYVVVVSETRP